jgi:hypothetical protein
MLARTHTHTLEIVLHGAEIALGVLLLEGFAFWRWAPRANKEEKMKASSSPPHTAL